MCIDIHTVTIRQKVTVFKDVLLCSLVDGNQYFERICCLHLQGKRLNQAQKILWHVDPFLGNELMNMIPGI
jgi:hypothetical protein